MTGKLESRAEECMILEACNAFGVECKGKPCDIWNSYFKTETIKKDTGVSYFPIFK